MAPLTESEKADMDAVAAIKESAAREDTEEGDTFVKMGRKHYTDAVDCCTRPDTVILLFQGRNLVFAVKPHAARFSSTRFEDVKMVGVGMH
ncbi:hypothetical protein ABZP36_004783 [Zizania latifolia]